MTNKPNKNTSPPAEEEEIEGPIIGIEEGESSTPKGKKNALTPDKSNTSKKGITKSGCPPCDKPKEPIDWIYIIKVIFILFLVVIVMLILLDIVTGGKLGIISFWVNFIKNEL